MLLAIVARVRRSQIAATDSALNNYTTREKAMMRSSLASLLLFAAAIVAAPSSHATVLHFAAELDGASEAPPNASAGAGTASVTIDDLAHTIRVQVDFSGLTAPTTAAHIHCCTAVPLAGTVGVATFPTIFPGFPTGVTSGSYDSIWDLDDPASYTGAFLTFGGGTAAGAEMALIDGLLDGRAYLNIHTSAFPAGEIRGFLAVPEPGMTGLLALALGAAFLARRRRIA